jgi:hypothetical protein
MEAVPQPSKRTNECTRFPLLLRPSTSQEHAFNIDNPSRHALEGKAKGSNWTVLLASHAFRRLGTFQIYLKTLESLTVNR